MIEMSIDIERLKNDREYWDSVAPEGATHYAKSGNWWKLGENGWSLFKSGRWVEIPSFPLLAIERPPEKLQAVEWDGTGLPPVGCECEVKAWAASWFTCAVLAHDGESVVCRMGDDYPNSAYDGFTDAEFRPIRTKEQRERDDLIEVIRGTKVMVKGSGESAISDAILSHYNLEPKD